MVVCPLDCRKLWKKICCSPRIAKCFFIGYNLLLLVAGICFIATGVYCIAASGKHDDFSELHPWANPCSSVDFIVTGIINFLTGLFGCCGVYKLDLTEKFFLAGVVMGLVLAFPVLTAGIISLSPLRDDDVLKGVDDRLKMWNWNFSSEHSNINDWDRLQERFKCCGVYSSDDWQSMTKLDPPASCCEPVDGRPTNCNTTDKTKLYTPGCATELVSWIENIKGFYKGHYIIFGVLQFLFTPFLCYFLSNACD